MLMCSFKGILENMMRLSHLIITICHRRFSLVKNGHINPNDNPFFIFHVIIFIGLAGGGLTEKGA